MEDVVASEADLVAEGAREPVAPPIARCLPPRTHGVPLQPFSPQTAVSRPSIALLHWPRQHHQRPNIT
jgi:hypothetical protein